MPISRAAFQNFGLLAGPLAAVVAWLLVPDRYFDPAQAAAIELGQAGRGTIAALVWMAVWWLTEAIDVTVTALLPLALFPLLGVASIGDAAAPYGSPVIFLFFGGFLIALAMQRWGLDRRIALLALRLVGTRPRHMVGGMMLATAALSAFVSNTATAAVMLPIGLSLAELAERAAADGEPPEPAGLRGLGPCLMLGIAYAASIGGVATLIGTPPNLFLAAWARATLGRDIGFARWLAVGVPLVAAFLPVAWWLLAYRLHRLPADPLRGGAELLRRELASLGGLSRPERATLTVFAAAAAGWIFRPLLTRLELAGTRPLVGLTDEGVAMIAALALFLIPVDLARRRFVMDWETARRVPWGVLVLFGGGLSLAGAVEANRVADFLGAQAHGLAGAPPLALVLGVSTLVIFLTELTSNTATAATLVPLLGALAPGLGVDPYLLAVPAAVAASCAFMLPVATPPNALVFGSGRISLPEMVRAGWFLNLIAIVLASLAGWWAANWL